MFIDELFAIQQKAKPHSDITHIVAEFKETIRSCVKDGFCTWRATTSRYAPVPSVPITVHTELRNRHSPVPTGECSETSPALS